MTTAIKSFAAVGTKSNGIPTGIDWRAADYQTASGQAELAKAMGDYWAEVRAARKTTLPGQVPTLPRAVDFELRLHGPVIDGGIVALFREVDRRGSANPVYTFRDLSTDAIVFEQKTPGTPAKLSRLKSGTAGAVAVAEWHGALGIDDSARRFDEYGEFEMAVQAVPAVYDAKVAEVHAALLNGVGGGVNQTWDTDLVTTVNVAGAQILEDCGDFYGVQDTPTFALAYNPRDGAHVSKMLASSYGIPNDNNSATQPEHNIARLSTRRVAAGTMYLVLPGYDMVRPVWDDLSSEFGRDYLRGADAFVWRSRWNAGIGNTKQIRRITLE